MAEREADRHAADWDDWKKTLHLLTVVANCGSVLCGTYGGGPLYSADDIAPWDKGRKKPGELDAVEVVAVRTFFGPGVHTLGPMGDPEERWRD